MPTRITATDQLGRALTLTSRSTYATVNKCSPSSKYEYRRTSAMLRNIRNIRIRGKKLSFPWPTKRISIKNSLPYKVHGPIYGRFMGCTVNGFLSILTPDIKVHIQVAQARQTSALLRNIRNIRICTGKKPIVSVTYENERISIKNSLPYLKCVLRLSCVVHGQIYGLPDWSHRLSLGLNSALPLKDSDTAWDSNYSHSGWETVSCSRWHQYPRKKTTIYFESRT